MSGIFITLYFKQKQINDQAYDIEPITKKKQKQYML